MQHMRFMVLTGHLDDYSLPGLIKMLHSQRKTGRLQVDYAESPAAFYFEEGRLVDARIGSLKGIEAVYLALSLAGASFNFNPLIKAPERTVEDREQKLIQGLLEAPSGGVAADIPDTGENGRALTSSSLATATPSLLPATDSESALPTRVEERLISEVGAVLALHSKRFRRERVIYATVIATLLAITFIPRLRNNTTATPDPPPDARSAVVSPPAAGTEIARPSETSKERVSNAVRPEAEERRVQGQAVNSPDPNSAKSGGQSNKLSRMPTAPASARKNESKTERNARPQSQSERTVKVLLRVERGRVLQAVVQNPHTGMESYEALALRIARQRQYPTDFSGRDILQLKVKP